MLVVAAVQYTNILYLRQTWGGRNRRNKKRQHQQGQAHGKMLLGKESLFLTPAITTLYPAAITSSRVLQGLVFSSHTSSFYTFTEHVMHHLPETMNHRIMRWVVMGVFMGVVMGVFMGVVMGVFMGGG